MPENKPDYVRLGGSIHPDEEEKDPKEIGKKIADEMIKEEEEGKVWQPNKNVKVGGSAKDLATDTIIDLEAGDIVED